MNNSLRIAGKSKTRKCWKGVEITLYAKNNSSCLQSTMLTKWAVKIADCKIKNSLKIKLSQMEKNHKTSPSKVWIKKFKLMKTTQKNREVRKVHSKWKEGKRTSVRVVSSRRISTKRKKKKSHKSHKKTNFFPMNVSVMIMLRLLPSTKMDLAMMDGEIISTISGNKIIFLRKMNLMNHWLSPNNKVLWIKRIIWTSLKR